MNIGIVAAEDAEMLAIKKLMKEISENKIYNLMKEKGWYKTEEVDQNKITTTKQKFISK